MHIVQKGVVTYSHVVNTDIACRIRLKKSCVSGCVPASMRMKLVGLGDL